MDQQVEEEDQDHLQGERRGGVTYEHFNDGDNDRNEQNLRRQFQCSYVRLRIGREASGGSGVQRRTALRDAGSADIRIAEVSKIHHEEFLRSPLVVCLAPNCLVATVDDGK